MAEAVEPNTASDDGRSIPLWQAIEYLLDGNVGLTRSFRYRRRRYDQKKNEWVLTEIERRGALLFGVDKASDKRVTIEPAGLAVSYEIVYWRAPNRRPIPRLQTRSTLHPTIIDHVYVERGPLFADEPIPEPHHVAMLVADETSELPGTAVDDAPSTEAATNTEATDATTTSAPVKSSPERKVGRPSTKKLFPDEIKRREAPPLNQAWEKRIDLAKELYTWLTDNPTLPQMKNVASVERALNKYKLWPRPKKAKL